MIPHKWFKSLVFFCAVFLVSFTYQLASASSLSPIKKGDPLPANRFIELAKLINPTVVNISTTQMPQSYGRQGFGGRDPFFDFLEQFMGRGGMLPKAQPAQSLGTGFIIREDGLIITNNHVIDKADIIKVQLSEKDKTLYEAEVIGKDKRTDIALIKIKADKKLPVAKLGTSSTLEVGEWVAAFGNPFGHGHSVTKGIISAKGREIDELNRFPFLQTDASINPGNSGGPLVNMVGEVIGVNTAIDARAQGIGFAIPIDDVKSIIKVLERDGHIRRGYMGVYLSDIDEQNAQSLLGINQSEGAVITQVEEGSPADKSGLKPYDFIFSINGKTIRNSSELIREVSDLPANSKAKLELYRNGKKKTITVKLGEHPESVAHFRRGQPKQRKSTGQLAQFGLEVADYSKQLKRKFELPDLKKGRPVVVSVFHSGIAARAGLTPGDVILDVNKSPVFSAKEVERKLESGSLNLLRVLRGQQVFFVYLRP